MAGTSREYWLAAEAAAVKLVPALAARGLTFGVAESCSGGRVASAITAVPGASDVFPGGVVSYTNNFKQAVLGVSASTLATAGPVSEQCAAEMARGLRRLANCDWVASITGIAGPGGGSVEAPVGLVYFAWLGPEDRLTLSRQVFGGSREEIQWQAACFCLGGLEALIK